ncbi:putative arginase [Aureobasidium pullulans]|uniref:Putative arginase n=1 Tax=Aureobasidium pullulans TaxID=5580 RepID=A0A4S9SXU8_AURPU|nr:putative arginase [Aureobasidium pullulans]
MPPTSVTLIFSPYHVGLRDHRVGNGPHRIRKLGIIKELEGLNIDIHIEELEAVDEFEGEIGKSFELLRRTSTAVSKACAHNSFPLILSGNCMATVGVAAGLGLEDLSFVYFDAHDDLETPSTNTNGYLDAMGMSMLKGESWHNLIATVPGFKPLSLDRLVYCGLRDISDESRQKVKEMKLDVVWGDSTKKVDFSTELGNVLDARALGRTHVHLDLDVLDDTLGKVNDYPSPGGLLESDLISCMELTPKKVAPTSLTVCSFDPHAGDGDKIAQIAVHAIFTFMSSLIETGGLLRSQS